MNVCTWRGRHSYMMRMYADKKVHIAFTLVAGCGVKSGTGYKMSVASGSIIKRC